MPAGILAYLAVYKLSGKDLRVCNAVLICEGLVFFWWAEPSLLLFFLSASILIYIMGRVISEMTEDTRRRNVMIFAVTMLAFVAVFYSGLPDIRFTDAEGQPAVLPMFSTALTPLGISFFVLSGISYILDIYINKAEPGSPADVLLYTMFFPKAACGPVVLWRDFRPQIHKRRIGSAGVTEGLKRIMAGYAKKAILADTFAAQIALIDEKMLPGGTDRATAWLLALLYFFMIYCDFSGYSDIAIGLCRVFGFRAGENFDHPYLSGSLTEFWRRWHISLGRWFREYIYIPLGGNRSGALWLNIMVTFCIAGIWHGWALNLLLWGAINGAIVAAEKYLQRRSAALRSGHQADGSSGRLSDAAVPAEEKSMHGGDRSPALRRAVRTLLTLLLVFFGWILFRAPDMAGAADAFAALFKAPAADPVNFTWRFFLTKRIAVYLVLAALGAFGVYGAAGRRLRSVLGENIYEILEMIVLLVIFAAAVMYVVSSPYTPFVYMGI